MRRVRRAATVMLLPVAMVAGSGCAALGLGGDGTARTQAADPDATFDYDFLIDEGTQARIDDGEAIEIVPAELVVHVGESIRIVNHDVVDHTVGAFFVAAGETLTQEFRSAGRLEGSCTVHPSGQFVLQVLE